MTGAAETTDPVREAFTQASMESVYQDTAECARVILTFLRELPDFVEGLAVPRATLLRLVEAAAEAETDEGARHGRLGE